MYPTQSEITAMRRDLARLFSDTCDIVREVPGADAYGGQSQAPQQVGNDIPCEVYPQVQALRPLEVVGSQIEVRMIWNVALPVGTDVQVGDKLTINSTGQETTVQSVLAPESLELELRVAVSLEGEPYV